MSKCENCKMSEARYEAVFLLPLGYRVQHVCDVCIYEDNRVTSPVKMLDTTFSRE
jgi:hypothetical protein